MRRCPRIGHAAQEIQSLIGQLGPTVWCVGGGKTATVTAVHALETEPTILEVRANGEAVR